MASAYQGAIEAVAAMGICLAAGIWIDRRFDIGPIGLFVGIGFGFAAMLLRLLRIRMPNAASGAAPRTARDDREGEEERPEDDDAHWSQALAPNRDREEERERDRKPGDGADRPRPRDRNEEEDGGPT